PRPCTLVAGVRMRKIIGMITVSILVCMVLPCFGQGSTVRLKVTKHSKSNTKTNWRSSDGRYRDEEKNSSVFYTIDLSSNISGPASEFTIKWAILVKGMGYSDGMGSSSDTRVVDGEKTCTLEFGKSFSCDTDVVELQGTSWTSGSGHKWEQGAKVLG